MKIYLLLLALALVNLSCAQNLRGRLLPIDLSGFTGLNLSNSTGQSNSSFLDNRGSGSDNTSIPDTNGTTTTTTTSSGSTGLNIPIVINNNQNNITNNDNANTTSNGDWTTVDITKAQNDSSFLTNLNYALSYVTALGIQSTLLKDETYSITQVYQILKQQDSYINYKVDLKITADLSGVDVNVSFTLYYDPNSNSRGMVDFYYQYLYLTSDNILNNNSVTWSNFTDVYTVNVNPTMDLNTNATTGPNLAPQVFDLNLTDYLALGGYVPDDVTAINNDTQLSNRLMFGAQYITNEGITNGYLLDNGSWSIMQIFSIYSYVSSDLTITYNRFEILIQNGAGGTAVVNFEVHQETGVSTLDVPTYGFRYSYD